jgi:ABC-2 type transport system permease protein
MALHRVLILARRVIQQLVADRRTIALIFIAPLVVLTVVGVLVRAETTPIAIGIVLEDEGATIPLMGDVNLGQRLTDSLSNLNEALAVRVLTADEAQTALDNGDLDAVVTLPADFSAQAVASRELNIAVEYEGSNPTAARLLEGLFTRGAVQTLASMSALGAQATTTTPPIHLQATYRYGSPDFDTLDYLAPVFIGFFVFLFVFILTSVAFLRERAAGTLERLLATPIRYTEVVVGYMLGFALFALLQSVVILGFTIFVLRVHYSGSLAVVFAVEALLALMAVNLGIFFSTYARNEFQVVQFIPLVAVTQILLSGAFWPIEAMPSWLQPIAWLMPLTHANRALRDVMIKGFDLAQVWPFVLALLAFIVGLVVLAGRTVRQQA